MRKFLNHSVTVFSGIVKWVVLASITGVIVGCSTFIFVSLLKFCINLTAGYPYFYLMLPLGMAVSAIMTEYLVPAAKGYRAAVEAIHEKSGRIDLLVVPVKAAATILTIATGGSAGREGPAAQIGAGLTSYFADLVKLNDHDRKKLVICGLSAGFASIFGTPIAGSIFGVEILVSGKLFYDVLLPSLVAGIISFQVTSALGTTYYYRPLHFVPQFSHLFFLKVLLFGLLMGFISLLFIESLKLGETMSKRVCTNPVLRAVLGGLLLAGLIYVIPGPPIYGLGVKTLESTLDGGQIIWYAFLVKIVFTSITLGFGGSGGVILPIFFTGATAGSFLGGTMGENPATFAAIGMAGLLSGAANAPIASVIFAMEVFGTPIAPYACLASIICYLVAGHKSVFPTKTLSMDESLFVHVEGDNELDTVQKTTEENKSLNDKT